MELEGERKIKTAQKNRWSKELPAGFMVRLTHAERSAMLHDGK